MLHHWPQYGRFWGLGCCLSSTRALYSIETWQKSMARRTEALIMFQCFRLFRIQLLLPVLHKPCKWCLSLTKSQVLVNNKYTNESTAQVIRGCIARQLKDFRITPTHRGWQFVEPSPGPCRRDLSCQACFPRELPCSTDSTG